MSDFWIWVAIVGLTGTTLITRAGVLLLGEKLELPPRLERALRYAPACALAAIIVPDFVFAHGVALLPWQNPRLIAAACAAVFFSTTRSMLWTIVFGMGALTALRWAL
jgi:branched-subunit amino acid transport protein